MDDLFTVQEFLFALAATAIVYFPFYGVRRLRYGRRPILRHLALFACIGCVLTILYLTVFYNGLAMGIVPEELRRVNINPLIWLRPPIRASGNGMRRQLVLNIIMFAPLGLLLPIAAKRLRKLWKTALFSLFFTLAIETTQYFTGRSADIDDLLMNLIGGIAGYLLFVFLRLLFQRFSWWRKLTGETSPAAKNQKEV